MFYPKLKIPAGLKRTLSVFRGYTPGRKGGDGEFVFMKNMSGRHYPMLSPRQKRSALEATAPRGMLAKQALCRVEADSLYIGDKKVEGLTLYTACEGCPNAAACPNYRENNTFCKKKLVSMGANILIFPDKKWVCTEKEDITFGDMEAVFQSGFSSVSYSLCLADGQEIADLSVIQPLEPYDGQYWQDGEFLKYYSAASESWVTVADTYVRLACPGIGKDFSQYDGVQLLGVPKTLEGHTVIWQVSDDALVVSGTVESQGQSNHVSILRQIPIMDQVTVCANRLWGCRYGKDKEGNFVNEIYCSKLGDFKNFSCFMGISTDSAVLNLGSDGPFTGAITHLDHPIFFKQNMLHKVYVSDSGAHGVTDTPCQGVQEGCGDSLCCLSGLVYYKAPTAVCVYDGSLPVEISADLGNLSCQSAAAGGIDGKYYLSLHTETGAQLLVYDSRKKLWHREDELHCLDFCAHNNELYAMTDSGIFGLLGRENPLSQPVCWEAVSADLGGFSPDSKYLTRLTVRMIMEEESKVFVYARYDFSDDWELLGAMEGKKRGSHQILLRPKRCDTLQLKFQGQGDVQISALTKLYEKGSDVP